VPSSKDPIRERPYTSEFVVCVFTSGRYAGDNVHPADSHTRVRQRIPKRIVFLTLCSAAAPRVSSVRYCVTIFDVYVVLQVARHSKGSVTAWRREQRSNFAVLWQ
jgi:hypothetical protein